jgi:hypothetical protein
MSEITKPGRVATTEAASSGEAVAVVAGSAKDSTEPKRAPPKPRNRIAAVVGRGKGRGRRRGRKPYPVMTFEQALFLGQGIMQHGAGHPMKRRTLLSTVGLGDGQATRNLITTSGRYAITLGSHQSDELRLTDAGRAAVDPATPRAEQTKTRFELAIASVPAFRKLYDNLKGGKMPAPDVMRDMLDELDPGDRPACVDVFIANAKFVGLLKTREGAACLDRLEDVLRESGASSPGPAAKKSTAEGDATSHDTSTDFDHTCFFVAPIGDEGSDHRRHSDAILAAFIEPALGEHKLKVVRADKISKPGMISAQIIEHIVKSRLVVADLSFHNPNVFYELALRHVTGKPTVHVIREADAIPFDVQNFRTIELPTGEVYSMLAKLETCKAETAQQIRQALADGVTTANPVLAFHPNAKFDLGGE